MGGECRIGIHYDPVKFFYIIKKMSEKNKIIKISELEKALIRIEIVTPLKETLNGLKPVYLPYILEECIYTSILESKNAIDSSKGYHSLKLNPDGEVVVSEEGKKYIAQKIQKLDDNFIKYAKKRL